MPAFKALRRTANAPRKDFPDAAQRCVCELMLISRLGNEPNYGLTPFRCGSHEREANQKGIQADDRARCHFATPALLALRACELLVPSPHRDEPDYGLTAFLFSWRLQFLDLAKLNVRKNVLHFRPFRFAQVNADLIS